ncbi:MAG TPA: hypothetical protein VHN59_09935, partial [Chitinophagaceae bacterium]|nr:hypothetical protein [Chitinophagaceae bacterium]
MEYIIIIPFLTLSIFFLFPIPTLYQFSSAELNFVNKFQAWLKRTNILNPAVNHRKVYQGFNREKNTIATRSDLPLPSSHHDYSRSSPPALPPLPASRLSSQRSWIMTPPTIRPSQRPTS